MQVIREKDSTTQLNFIIGLYQGSLRNFLNQKYKLQKENEYSSKKFQEA